PFKVAGQSLPVILKLPAPSPVRATLSWVSGAPPPLPMCSVVDCVWLPSAAEPNDTLDGDTESAPAASAWPVSVTVAGPPGSATAVSVALLSPGGAPGLKPTATTQCPPGGSAAVQPLLPM